MRPTAGSLIMPAEFERRAKGRAVCLRSIRGPPRRASSLRLQAAEDVEDADSAGNGCVAADQRRGCAHGAGIDHRLNGIKPCSSKEIEMAERLRRRFRRPTPICSATPAGCGPRWGRIVGLVTTGWRVPPCRRPGMNPRRWCGEGDESSGSTADAVPDEARRTSIPRKWMPIVKLVEHRRQPLGAEFAARRIDRCSNVLRPVSAHQKRSSTDRIPSSE